MFHRYNPISLGIILAWSLRAICDSTVSIASVQPYLDQRYCVRDCLWSGFDNNLESFLGCPDPYANNCYCRDDLASSASSYITTCVNGGCSSNTPDVVRAMSVYNGYCSSAAPAVNTATPTVDDSGITTTIRVTATPTVDDSGATTTVQVKTTVSNSPSTDSGTTSQVSTITSTFPRPRSSGTLTTYSTETFSTRSNNSLGKGSSSGGLSQSDKIALGVGLGVGLGMGIPPIVIAIYSCKKKNRRVNSPDQQIEMDLTDREGYDEYRLV